jgi:hypothetical protein
VEPACLQTLRRLARQGLTIVSTRKLAPPEIAGSDAKGYSIHVTGAGRWIVTDDANLPEVRKLLAPYLGRPDELRYVFGDMEVVFTTPAHRDRVEVRLRGLPARSISSSGNGQN